MGDRVSISFKDNREESVVLFNHWGGKNFAFEAYKYAQELFVEKQKEDEAGVYPLARFEPNTVMVDFLRYYLVKRYGNELRVDSSLYFGKTREDGDNSDNGHFCIKITSEGVEFDGE